MRSLQSELTDLYIVGVFFYMDFEQQLDTEHLLLEDRVCRTCGVSKSLLADYYRNRKNVSLVSSYSYECKTCTSERIKKRSKQKYKLGTCEICGASSKKLKKDICQNCDKGIRNFKYDIDILKSAVLYLET